MSLDMPPADLVVTDEMREQSYAKKSAASEAASAEDYDTALSLYTECLMLNPSPLYVLLLLVPSSSSSQLRVLRCACTLNITHGAAHARIALAC